jgi:hypothetical protein
VRRSFSAAAVLGSVALAVLGGSREAVGSPRALPRTPHGLERARDHYTVPGEVTRFSGHGPAGSKLTVVSALGADHVTCIKLVITDPPAVRSRSVPGVCSAPTRKKRIFYAFWTYRWKSPSGHTYLVYFGDASTTVARLTQTKTAPASIVVTGSAGSTPAGRHLASVKLQRGWFAIGFAVPHHDNYSVLAETGSGHSLAVLASHR